MATVSASWLSLAPLLASPKLSNPAITLTDTRGQPTGTLSITVEMREQTQPKPISLRGQGVGRGQEDDDERGAQASPVVARGAPHARFATATSQ